MITLIPYNARKVGILMLLVLLLSCSKSVDNSGIADPSEIDCNFRTGRLDESYCRVSIYKLVTAPELFVGRPIYTVGYIEKGSDGSVGLSPSPDVFETGDMVSCVVVVDYVLGSGESPDSLQAEGLYAVAIAGKFSEPVRGLCAGRLSRAVISNVRTIERY